MTLLNLLPFSDLTLETARGYALVFTAELAQTLADVQTANGDPRHQAVPALLTDGRYMLSADLLTEVGSNGLYRHGFGHLPQELFPSVSVLPIADAIALIPTPDPYPA